ncbi:MAG: cupin domain-containing protein [Dehalococcoidia bacterium]
MAEATLARWDGIGAPSGAALEALFAAEGLKPYSWSNGPGETYQPHSHSYHKVLYCVSGEITFRLLPRGIDLKLAPGDRLDIPPRQEHAAFVGPRGVTCLEAPRPG